MKTEIQPIKLLGISGSLRAGSYSTALLRALGERHCHVGVELAIRTLEAIPLYNEDHDTHEGLSAVDDLKRAIAASDGVAVTTPEYNHGVPGVLKNALDWVSRPAFASPFKDKPVLIASCSTAFTGGVRAQYQLRETLVSMLADVVSTREIVVGNVGSKLTEGRFTDEESLAQLERGLERLLERVRAQRLRNATCS